MAAGIDVFLAHCSCEARLNHKLMLGAREGLEVCFVSASYEQASYSGSQDRVTLHGKSA